MLKRIAAILLALTLVSAVGCGDTDESSKSKKSAASADSSSNAESSQTDESEDEPEEQTASSEIGENGAKAVYKAELTFTAEENGEKVLFDDLYGKHALHTAVVGLVGAPVEVNYNENRIKGGKLTFYIDKDELLGVRPDALMFLFFEEDKQNYLELSDTVIDDSGELTASIDIDSPGVYLLVNKYTWLNAWGAGLDDDGYEEGYVPGIESIAPSAEWELNEDVGDIIKLTDKDYLMQNVADDRSAVFHVSTPEQLASACYYVNCCKDYMGQHPDITIELDSDIDLNGINWSPMGWYMAGMDNRFKGTINGNGHSIKNLNVRGHDDAGLIGISFYCKVNDLKIENAYIEGTTCGVLLGEDISSTVTNVECSGIVNGSEGGSIGGDYHTKYIGCKANVIVNGADFGNEFFSYGQKAAARAADEFGRPEKLTVKGSKVIREAGLEDKYDNLGWSVSAGLERGAEKETEFDLSTVFDKGEYTVELTAFIDGRYIPISEPVTVIVE